MKAAASTLAFAALIVWHGLTAAQTSTQPVLPPAGSDRTIPSTLQSLVQPLWSELSASQRQVLKPFEPQWNTWPAQEKRIWVSLADRFPQFGAVEKQRAEKRIKEWAALTPEQRRLARSNYRLANQLPKTQLAEQKQRYEGMTSEQRDVLRENGSTSNTAAKYGGARTGLAKEAAQPLAAQTSPTKALSTSAGASNSLMPQKSLPPNK